MLLKSCRKGRRYDYSGRWKLIGVLGIRVFGGNGESVISVNCYPSAALHDDYFARMLFLLQILKNGVPNSGFEVFCLLRRHDNPDIGVFIPGFVLLNSGAGVRNSGFVL
jgi:hypothetical protein